MISNRFKNSSEFVTQARSVLGKCSFIGIVDFFLKKKDSEFLFLFLQMHREN